MIAILLILLGPASAFAWDAQFRGNVRTIFAADAKHDDPAEHYYDSNTRLFAEAKLLKDSWSATVSAKARYTLSAPHDVKTRYNIDLYEAYVRWARQSVSVEAGERIVRWGVMEYVSPTDAINPRDLTQIIDPEVDDRYLPIPLLRFIFEQGRWTAEAIYQPFFRRSRFDLIGTDAALVRPDFFSVVGLPFVDLASNLDDTSEFEASDLVGNLPEDNPLRGEGGARFGVQLGTFDIDFLYLTKRETTPSVILPAGIASLSFTPATPGIGTPGEFQRDQMIGSTLRWISDNGLTLKGETLFKPTSSVYDSALFFHRQANLTWALGLDYDWNLTHLFTLEYAQDRFFSNSFNSYFLRDETQHLISGAAIFNFDSKTWTVELKGIGVPEQSAYWLNPRLVYRPESEWEFALGSNVLGGDAASLYGLLSNNDQIFVSAKYLF